MADLLPEDWDVDPALRAQLGDEEGNMRSIACSGDLLVLLAEVPVEGDTDRDQVIYWWQGDSGRWECSVPGWDEHPLKLIRAYESALENIECRLETSDRADQVYGILDELVPFTRSGRGLLRAFAEARSAFPEERQLILLRDRAAGIQRLADHLLQDARHALSFIAAKHAEEQADAAQRLNRIVLFFLPLTALSGAFGMNVPNLLESQPHGFYLVVGAALFIGAVLVLVFGRPSRTS